MILVKLKRKTPTTNEIYDFEKQLKPKERNRILSV